MPTRTRQRTSRAIAGWLVIALMSLMLLAPAGHAAGAESTEIRVALLISTRGTVPAATFESASPLAVAVQGSDASGPVIRVEADRQVRFSMSGYALIVRETTDLAAALDAYYAVSPYGHAEIMADELQGRTVYQVRLSGYASKAEAESAANRVPLSGAPSVAGPLYASAGTFATEAEAETMAAFLSSQGIRAWTTVHPDADGFGAYSAWFGEAATSGDLDREMAAVLTVLPGAALRQVDGTVPYLVRRTEIAAGTKDRITHYRFNPSGQEVRISGDGSFPIKVHERYGRTYRGSMAVTAYEGKLAVVNVLPLEQYLYAVVGSEMPGSWPIEALKAQAVAARTYARSKGLQYKIAHVSDTTYDQAYLGTSAESQRSIEAVEATRGEVLKDASGLLIEALYASNHGGMSADPSEVWGNGVSHLKSAPSPDQVAERDKLVWYRIMLADGTSGYVRSDLAVETDAKSESGLPVIEVTGDGVNIRRAPRVDNTDNPAVAQANRGDRFTVIGRDVESNAYSWIRGPYTSEQLKSSINARSANAVQGSLTTLEVTGRGPSGRVTEIAANGKSVNVSYPDLYRSALNGLPSTLFDIEETGKFSVLAAFGTKREYTAAGNGLTVLSAKGESRPAGNEFYILDAKGNVRAATTAPAFRFIGRGFGHGLGLSQYGALSLAESGYDYRDILAYYYDGVIIAKE